MVKIARVDFAAFVAYSLLVAFISLRPGDTAGIEPWDKLFHLLIYGVFGLLASRLSRKPGHLLYLGLGIVAYSALMELAQSYMPGRVMSVYDLLANILGVVVGVLAGYRFFGSGRPS